MTGLIQIEGVRCSGLTGDRTPNTEHRTPLALYLHIPFCVRKCHYCDFNSGPASEEAREAYVRTLCQEIRQSPWRGSRAWTVFFGGGTPSELTTTQLARICGELCQAFR